MSGERKSRIWDHVRRLLVMRLDNIGDVIMMGPALKAIKENLPEAELVMMVSPAGAQAAPLLPWIDDLIGWRALWQDIGKPQLRPDKEFELIEALRLRGFDLALAFTSFSQSPHPAAFVCRMAGIPRFYGQSQESGWSTLPAFPVEENQAERNLYLIESLGLTVKDRNLDIRIPKAAEDSLGLLARNAGLEISQDYIVLNPWTSCDSRTYPSVRFAQAARALSEITGMRVALSGAPKERQKSPEILQILGTRAVDLVGRTDVCQFAALVARARVVLTGNTSALHLADATLVPVVVPYSGTELESQWAPRSAPHKLLLRRTDCTPCYRFSCPFDHECLDIPPEEVVAAAMESLASGL
ncbi:MAG TPA: glycosyltransferase family 9 protein [Acidobacteriota bacterium]|nr:glycosyltransferase family 9 protein [Acidobacteriota bacterium]